MSKTAADVLSLVADEEYEFVDLRFCDLPGQVQHFTVPVKQLTEDSFEAGFGFDGSSIRGFQQIQESDMILIPDPDTAIDDPFRARKTLIIYCFVNDPITGTPYDRDPRYVAKKAEEYLISTGLADTSYWGPEAEFYIFDDVRFGQNQFSGYYFVDSVEGAWNSGEFEEGGNLGYKPRYKEGYFPVPPTDHFQDLRSEMTANLEAAGIEIEVQHHEVGTAGQAEIDMRYDTLLRTADNVTLYKYIVKNTAWEYGKSVTFMPKPIFEDNGSGMHTHQSLWKDGEPLFFDEAGYAGLSDMARWYIGGSPEARGGDPRLRCPDHELLSPPGPRLRGAGEPGVLESEPVGGDPDPAVLTGACGQAARVPLPGSVLQPVPGLLRHAHGRSRRGAEPDRASRAGGQGHLRPASAELAGLPSVPGSLTEALDALKADHEFLLQGGVFSQELIEAWIDYKIEHEVDPVRLRPHPYEFHLYYDI